MKNTAECCSDDVSDTSNTSDRSSSSTKLFHFSKPTISCLRSKILEVPVSNPERDLKVTCCSETGSLYVTAASTNKTTTFMDCPSIIVNCSGGSIGIGAIRNDLNEASTSSNYNLVCNQRTICPDFAVTNDSSRCTMRSPADLDLIPTGLTCSIHNPSRNNSDSGAASVISVRCDGNNAPTSNIKSYYNGNMSDSGNVIASNIRDSSVRSRGSASPPEAKRQRTMLEKTCAIWEGFEPLKPTRQLTVSE